MIEFGMTLACAPPDGARACVCSGARVYWYAAAARTHRPGKRLQDFSRGDWQCSSSARPV